MSSLEGEFASEMRGRFVLVLRVPNPGGQPADLIAFHWELWNGKERFALGMERLSVPLTPEGVTLNFELPVSLLDPLELELGAWAMGVRGHLVAQRGERQHKIEFREARVVQVRKAKPKPPPGWD